MMNRFVVMSYRSGGSPLEARTQHGGRLHLSSDGRSSDTMPGLSRAGTADTMRGFGRAGTDCFVLFQAINKIMVRVSQLEW